MEQNCICWLICVWASRGDRAVSLKDLSMEAVSGYTPRQPGWAVLSCPAASRAHRDLLPASLQHHLSGELHKGVYPHACDIAYR